MRILITAGPTREPLDPVRFISNYSTGIFGYELAKEAIRRCHRVTLISGPTFLKPPSGAKIFNIETAQELEKKLRENFPKCDCLIMNAAVCDYKPARYSPYKLKSAKKTLRLALVQNPDILSNAASCKGKRIIAGFALETENLKDNALRKLRRKNMDLILGTLLTKHISPFGSNKLKAVLIDRNGRVENFANGAKRQLASVIINRAEQLSRKTNVAA